MKTSTQQGFTLIELIVVIVILGILSATALPKFIDLGKDARTSVVQAVEGSMRSANSMIYAKAAAANVLTGVTTVTVGGVSIGITNGFATTATQLALAMDLDASKIATDATAGGGLYYAGYTKATCGVAYTASTGVGIAPLYATTVTGC